MLKRDVVLVSLETADGERGFAPAGASNFAMREYFDSDSQGTFADIIGGPVADVLRGEELGSPVDIKTLLCDTDLVGPSGGDAVDAQGRRTGAR